MEEYRNERQYYKQEPCEICRPVCDIIKSDFDCCTKKCYKLKEVAEQKLEQSSEVGIKAREAERQAMLAQERAEYYKKLAIEACNRANEYWDEYRDLSNCTVELVKEARMYMARFEECLIDCQCQECICDLNDYGIQAPKRDKHNDGYDYK